MKFSVGGGLGLTTIEKHADKIEIVIRIHQPGYSAGGGDVDVQVAISVRPVGFSEGKPIRRSIGRARSYWWPPLHSLTVIDRSRSLGAVRDNTVTAIAITQKATPATVF